MKCIANELGDDAYRLSCMSVESVMQFVIMNRRPSEDLKTIGSCWNCIEENCELTMSTKFQKLDSSVPQSGRAPDVSSIDAGMNAGHADTDSLPPTAKPDRSLRNKILLANAFVWIAIIVLIRWLFF
jgi:hypothetical protein